MKLVVGLGNPSPDYDGTRHNAGYLVIDRLSKRHELGGDRAARQQFQSLALDAFLAGQRCLLLKPLTYMNRSGRAVAEAMRFFKLEPEDLLVAVDDLSLPAGRIRLRRTGGAGGHNGLRDIENHLGTRDYARLRIGIDPPGRLPQVDYVLGRFSAEQRRELEPALDQAADATECWLSGGIEAAMNRFNGS